MSIPVAGRRRLLAPPADCAACPLRRITLFTDLDAETVQAVQKARIGARQLVRGELIYAEGDPVRQAFTMFDGYAIRYWLLSSGRRQVLHFVLPGDFLFILDGERVWPETAEVVTDAVLCALSVEELRRLFDDNEGLPRAIAQEQEADRSLLEEHMTDLGRRPALDRVGRLLLEFFHREWAAGRTSGNRCYMPYTQEHIGDAIGLTSVHVSRIHSELQRSQLMTLHGRLLTILDREAAERRFEFEPGYMRKRPLI